jgi:DNA repair exonuclease SbcCD ATPase subunit
VVEFSAEGITLIEGPSGIGKSSLFKAICWCMYGKEKNTYNWVSSKKKCMVELSMNNDSGDGDIVIIRQKNPERVSLFIDNKEFVSDEAQEYINRKWGKREEWIACNYLSQNNRSIIINGTSAEKIELLELLAFPNDNPSEWIEKFNKDRLIVSKELDSIQRTMALLTKNKPDQPCDLSLDMDEYTDTNKIKWDKKITLLEKDITLVLNQLNVQESITIYKKQLDDYTNSLQSDCWSDKELKEYDATTRNYEIINHYIEEKNKLSNDLSLFNNSLIDEDLIDKYYSHYTTLQNYEKKLSTIRRTYNKDQLTIYCKEFEKNEPYYNIVEELKKNSITSELLDKYNNVEINDEQERDLHQQWKSYNVYQSIIDKYKIKDWNSFVSNCIIYNECKNYIPFYINYNMIYDEYSEFLSKYCDTYDDEPEDEQEILIYLQKKQQEIDKKREDVEKLKNVLRCPSCNIHLTYNVKQHSLTSNEHHGIDCDYDEEKISNYRKETERVKKRIDYLIRLDKAYSSWKSCSHSLEEIVKWMNDNKKITQDDSLLKQIYSLQSSEYTKPSITLDEVSLIKKIKRYITIKEQLCNIDYNNEWFNVSLKTHKEHYMIIKPIINEWIDVPSYTKNELLLMKEYYTKQNKYNDICNKVKDYDDKLINTQLIIDRKKEYQQKYEDYTIHQQKMKEILKISDKIKELEHKLITSTNMSTVEELTNELSLYKKYSNDYLLLIPYTKYIAQYKELTDTLNNLEKKMICIHSIIDTAKKLENELLDQFVESFNTILESVLNETFEDPLHVSLVLYKGDKPSVQLQLIYKGAQLDNVMELSGGEIDRISLAIMISLHLNSSFPFLLLDESFGSLDGDTKLKCVDVIKTLLPNKGVLVIAHGETEGDYVNHMKL